MISVGPVLLMSHPGHPFGWFFARPMPTKVVDREVFQVADNSAQVR
jgi:hypothetical protein